MLRPARPIEEVQRLQTLNDYRILDSLAEQDFDDLTALASTICEVPISLISLIDADRQWFKSKIGIEASQSPRDVSFCAHAILGQNLFTVNDAANDERFADNPFVTSDPHIRFYAGMPLIGPEGHAFGTLCVIDRVPRKLRPDQAAALEALGRQVVSQMRLRKTAESLLAAERFTRATIDAIPSSIAKLNERGEILSVNVKWTQFHERWGRPDGFGIGDNYLLACDKSTNFITQGKLSFAARLELILKGELAELSDEYFMTVEEDRRWFGVKVSRFTDHGAVRLIIMHDDITEQKRVQELELERRSLKDAITSLEQVLGVVGHELRTPLAGLRAMTDFLTNPAAREMPEWKEFLHALGDEVVRMSDTVDSLLEAARLNSGRAHWNWSLFSVEPICCEAMETARLLMPVEQISLGWDVEPSARKMLGDAAGIRRLLLNLLSNSGKHTAAGKIQISVTGSVVDGQHWIELHVSDTGNGIRPEILARVGEAFALNSGVVGENCVSGTGLGLAICKSIAAAHGGYLSIYSTSGQGTTVTAKLRADLPGPIVSARVGDVRVLAHIVGQTAAA